MNQYTDPEKSNSAKAILFVDFEPNSQNYILSRLGNTTQAQYLVRYLSGLDCKTIIVEQNYFDRDYLSEFSEFYSSSAKGYRNICERWHFFSGKITREDLLNNLEEAANSSESLQNLYLGFSVIRPIPTPIGRTVLKWYENHNPTNPRLKATRKYKVHLVGVELEILGLAWQQQDSGVGACATIALWSAIHSSAFDEFYKIPTTSELTRLAHKSSNSGRPIFPSNGLTNFQILEAIKELGFFPAFEYGNKPGYKFSKKRFGMLSTMFIRSGFPIILTGKREGSTVGHAICMTGFRESYPNKAPEGEVTIFNENISTAYIHDDNLGPNVRFKVEEKTAGRLCDKFTYISIKSEAPDNNLYGNNHINDPTLKVASFVPTNMIVALPGEIRLSPESLRKRAYAISELLIMKFNQHISPSNKIGASLDISYMKLSDYLSKVIPSALKETTNKKISRTKMQLCETVAPMSKFLGVVRILYKNEPVLDLLYDTSDSASNSKPFATVSYQPQFSLLINAFEKADPVWQYKHLGKFIDTTI